MRLFDWFWVNTLGNPLVWIAALSAGIANANGVTNWVWLAPLAVMLFFARDVK